MRSHYFTFVKIVESETLVCAAETLHTTQPTLTRQLHQLENEFGVKLFDRIGKKLVLNPAGKMVYQYAKQLVTLENRMQEEISAFMNPEIGLIRIGAGLTPSIYLLPQLFSLYRTYHPNVRFHVRTGSSQSVFTYLLGGEIDLGIVTTLGDGTSEVKAKDLIRDELLLVAPMTHPLVAVSSCRIRDVAVYPVVLMRVGSGLRRIVDDLAINHGFAWNIVTETDSLESMNRLVQNGLGLSVLPRSSVQDDLSAGRLSVIPLYDVNLGARTITLIQRASGQLPAVSAQFAVHLPTLLSTKDTPAEMFDFCL